MSSHPKYQFQHARILPTATRKQLLDGVVIPHAPHKDADISAFARWHQTSHTTPYLYLPPVETYLADNISTPHTSTDVLVAVRTPGNDRILLVGWFNYLVYEWQYYGVTAAAYDDYRPHYWAFLHPAIPIGWRPMDQPNTRSD